VITAIAAVLVLCHGAWLLSEHMKRKRYRECWDGITEPRAYEKPMDDVVANPTYGSDLRGLLSSGLYSIYHAQMMQNVASDKRRITQQMRNAMNMQAAKRALERM
jgi:ABC-type nickel/cobalt efflux system permease component RcnA